MNGYFSVVRRVFQPQKVEIDGDFVSSYTAQFLVFCEAVRAVIDAVQEELKEEEDRKRG